MKYYHIILIIIGFIVFFCALWIFITFLISRTGSWHQLSKTYTTSYIPPKEKIIKRQLGKIGIARYKFSLTIAFTDQGLYLSVNKAFRLFHPPLLIPWNKIKNPRKSADIPYRYVVVDVNGIKVSLAEKHYDLIMKYLSIK